MSTAGPEDITNANYPDLIESFDYPNADISDVVKAISELTGKNFIVDPSVRGKITIMAPTQITVAEAYKAFLRNYRRSPRAQEAQFSIAENYEHLGQWVPAMDQYTNYVTNFPEGPLATKAREQINFIKTYRL